MSTVIKVENLGKQYRLGSVGTGTLSHDLNRWWHKVRGLEDPYLKIGETNDRTVKGNSDYVWALKDINFEVKQGEVLGIIGRNGAGKSTLLKILSQVTNPTIGEVKIKGRIASLLEVGTGFHPELTGRENIFLNGAILGMTKQEIRSKFDEIVDFSGVERYVDTPVKRYSSGMYVRLAFAVAAHLDPEILIVDEVLAVGDAEFQEKCLGKMKDVSGQGRTVLFVSHNMASMKSLCKRGLLMQYGNILLDSPMNESIEKYLATTTKTSFNGEIPENASSMNTDQLKFTKFLVLNSTDEPVDTVNYLSDINLYFEINSDIDIEDTLIDIRVNTLDGIEIVHASNKYKNSENFKIKKGLNVLMCKLKNSLQPGKYSFTIGVHLPTGATLDFVENIFDFNVTNVSSKETGDFIYDFKLGIVRFESDWQIKN